MSRQLTLTATLGEAQPHSEEDTGSSGPGKPMQTSQRFPISPKLEDRAAGLIKLLNKQILHGTCSS